MGVIQEFKEAYETLKKDRYMLAGIRILFYGFILLCIVNVITYYVDRSNNIHATMLWGFAEYFPYEIKDTLKNNEIKSDSIRAKIIQQPQLSHTPQKKSEVRKVFPLTTTHIVSKAQLLDTSDKVLLNAKNALIARDISGGTVHVGDTYNKPPQRIVQESEIKGIIGTIPSKDYWVKVISNESIEGKNFRDQILAALARLGYSNLTQAERSGMNAFGEGRLSIRNGHYGNDNWVEILVNPQE